MAEAETTLETLMSLEALLPVYRLEPASYYQKGVFWVSRYYTKTKCSINNTGNYWRLWDKVANNLFVGVVPALENSFFSNVNQHEQIFNFINKQPGTAELGMVVSCVEGFVNSDPSIVKTEDWKKLDKNIVHIILPWKDFTADVPTESVIAVVKQIRECIEQGKSVYIHCKAGRSRSAMLALIYLAVYGDDEDPNLKMADVDYVIKFLTNRRPQLAVDEDKRIKSAEIIRIMRAEKKAEDLHTDAVEPVTLRDFLSSLRLKNAITRFASFRRLERYFHQGKQPDPIKDFFMSIHASKDDKWYRELVKRKGPMQQFVNATSSQFLIFEDSHDKSVRINLCNDFLKELTDYLMKTFHCTIDQLTNPNLRLNPLQEIKDSNFVCRM